MAKLSGISAHLFLQDVSRAPLFWIAMGDNFFGLVLTISILEGPLFKIIQKLRYLQTAAFWLSGYGLYVV